MGNGEWGVGGGQWGMANGGSLEFRSFVGRGAVCGGALGGNFLWCVCCLVNGCDCRIFQGGWLASGGENDV
jgi:hypothetical protein